jgi:hypothetical protein
VDDRAIVVAHDIDGLRITPMTSVTQWMGEALELDVAVEWLIQAGNRRKNVPAGTHAD